LKENSKRARTELQKLEIRVNCQKEDVKPSEPKPE
jgi:hypothetical protein